MDDTTSPCIDRGDPNSPVGDEPDPNGGLVNMGAYGGTQEASMSIGMLAPLSPLPHWKLDETEGDIAYDSAGDSDGTLVGDPVWQPDGGMLAGALQLDGVDDYVSTEFVLNPADGAFSVFAWIKGGAPGQAIISQTDGFNWLCVDASEGNLMTELRYVSRGGSGAPLVSQTPIIDGDWHRVGLSWDGADRILYVDDVEIAGDTQPGMVSSRSGLYIGAGGSRGEGTFWSGLIDDFRIYNRAVRP